AWSNADQRLGAASAGLRVDLPIDHSIVVVYWSSVNATPRDAVLRTDFDDIRGASVGPSGSPSAPTLDERRPLSSSRADAQGELRAASCRNPRLTTRKTLGGTMLDPKWGVATSTLPKSPSPSCDGSIG